MNYRLALYEGPAVVGTPLIIIMLLGVSPLLGRDAPRRRRIWRNSRRPVTGALC
jgi:hypothetical protein